MEKDHTLISEMDRSGIDTAAIPESLMGRRRVPGKGNRPQEIRIQRVVQIPDPVRIARYQKAPELGPKVLFFSGGSSLREFSRKLIDFTHNSIHLITPFDSGGSSAEIRKTFNMLSVGDLRNRLMALADQSHRGNPDVYELFSYRFPSKAKNWDLFQELNRIANAKDAKILKIPNPLRRIIRNHLHYFLERMPGGFDLHGASLGNLILAGGYLNNRRHIEPVIFLFSNLVEVRGIVKPITGRSYHLCAHLDGGRKICGQHLLTGKEVKTLSSRIKKIHLVKSIDADEPAHVVLKNKIKDLIIGADLICYPFGSFYTSLIANLLPKGVGQAVGKAHCPKVYIPNQEGDPEMVGTSLYRSVEQLLHYLQQSCDSPTPVNRLLDFILLDTQDGRYAKPLHLKKIQDLGIQVIDSPLISARSAPYFDSELVMPVLLSLT